MEDVWTGAGLLRYVITGLAIATEYKVQVRAVRTTSGSWSTAVIGTTAWGAVWSFQSAFTDPGSDVEVTVAVGGVGAFGEVVERLPYGFRCAMSLDSLILA